MKFVFIVTYRDGVNDNFLYAAKNRVIAEKLVGDYKKLYPHPETILMIRKEILH